MRVLLKNATTGKPFFVVKRGDYKQMRPRGPRALQHSLDLFSRFSFLMHEKSQKKLIKRSGEFFFFLNQLYSNTDLINAYLHIQASLKSVLNNI